MVKARAWLALGLMSLGTVATTVGCGSDETTGGGGGLITAGAGGSAAGTGGSGAVGRGGSTASGGSSGSGTVASGSLGLPCTSDLDCGGLTCILPTGTDFGTGGPGQGMCTQLCQTDDDCQAAEAGSGCVQINTTTSYCFESCTTGEPTDASSKCQGRGDFFCGDLSQAQDGSATFCLPLCQADAECPTGEYCSEKSGLCEKTKPTGLAAGASCDPSAATDPCLGLCFRTDANDATKGICADFCAAETECHFTGTKAGGICVGTTQDAGLFDPGICEYACNCDSDCPLTGDVCVAWDANANATLKSDLGTPGFCFPKTGATGSTELTSCGGSSGTAGAGGTGGAGGAPAGGAGGTGGGTGGAETAGTGGAAAGSGGAAAGTGGSGG